MRIAVEAIGKILAAIALLAVALVLYNVIRHVVFRSPAEEVTFRSDGVTISGTLVKPAAGGVFLAIVILHGSGPETRTEFSYRVMATTLRRSGLAVLLYDKRGAGSSGGDFESARYSDFIDDAIAAVRYLAGREDIDGEQIGLVGNSESGWFTPEIVSRTSGVAFVINKAGPPLSWLDTVLWENRNEYLDGGVAEADVQRLVDLTRRRWVYYQRAGVDPSLASSEEREAINQEIAEIRATVPFAESVLDEALRPYDPEWYARFAENSTYDLDRFLRAIDIPLLYVFSGLDVNVPTEPSVAYLESLVAEHGKDITIHVFQDVGHSMATWKGAFNAGYVPGLLDLVASWSAEQLREDRRSAQ